MRSVSKKRAKELREYTKLRKSFLNGRPYCEILRTLGLWKDDASHLRTVDSRIASINKKE